MPEELEQWYAYRRYFFRGPPLTRDSKLLARLTFTSLSPLFVKIRKKILKGHCHAIWQFYKKLEGVFASIEFQK